MVLQDNLYTILSQQQEDGHHVFHLRLHPEWPIYKSHFPGHPITPGVCIVQTVQELLQRLMHRHLTLVQAKNVKYPIPAQENGISGRVVISFVVETDGSITQVQVAKPVDPLLDKEAARVVSSMPKWVPGQQNGQKVRVKYNVPVMFKLQ